MKNYYIWTIGCQMNKADSAALAGALESAGYCRAASPAEADLVVVNSCSVRENAEQRVYGKLGALADVKRSRPGTIIALMGCMVGADDSELRARLPMVDYFFPPAATRQVLDRVVPDFACDGALGKGIAAGSWEGAVAAFVPIIHGCDNFCTYCIVPYRRGREQSRPVEDIVRETEDLVRKGVKEVTLLGQNVNSYGHYLRGTPDLADLFWEVNGVEGLERIRFLTSHPKDMSERLIEAIASVPKVCEYVNLPVQSGDDEVLKRMGRRYNVAKYEETISKLRDRVSDLALATDLIVGFPGESYEQFQNSYALLERVGFDQVHVAAYSRRPGTAAAHMGDDVSVEEKKARLEAVELLQERVAASINAQLVGRTVEVLFEDLKDGKWQGRTRTNKLVFVQSGRDIRGLLAAVQIIAATPWSLRGELA
ncbi:MAG: tRNA (N6-isopentenyl adenosine(37)-C2)-methylthiotransferase MiaB [Chloroflexi bacterium]|nr:tRNA (N6-isopentenyl adenosine(37)-C2)-methylthiotransferase MiaB [Chloroflexota bacterium]